MSLPQVILSAKFHPNVCTNGPLDWNPIGSAGAFSAFCGILAGFVFSGVVMVIGQQNPMGGDGHASRGLRLLMPSFFGLAVTSYLYSVVTGELVCRRALVEQLFVGGVLAANAVVVIAALAWLFLAYGRNSDGEVRFLRGLVLVSAIFAMFMLATSSVGFHNAWTDRKAAGWADWMVWGSFVALLGGTVVSWRKPVPPVPAANILGWPYDILNKRVNFSAWLNLLTSAGLAGFSGYFVGTPYDKLNYPRWEIYAMSEGALIVPAVVIMGVLWALPRE
ncbi:hypothetical protein OG226_01265 [Streptomyces sp. NBC_01261]|uniref:hypothetical protein n=1 Tax=Streptomyces sp. NBC_01261 TaxID=2903802 RepID=UPI002E2FA114|nr:hypothetical protein [Streptomyces sp. NBC_01261]